MKIGSGMQSVSRAASRYLPEPATGGVGLFKDFMQKALGVASTAANPMSAAAGNLGQFERLLEMQLQAQMEMQTVSMVSNIQKAEHDTKMASIRNMRVN